MDDDQGRVQSLNMKGGTVQAKRRHEHGNGAENEGNRCKIPQSRKDLLF